MINGKAVLKFGAGSIMVTPLCNNLEEGQLGAVCFNQTEPGEINRRIPVVSQEFSEKASVVMTFSNPDSIDVVIEALVWVKNTMNHVTPETDRIGWSEPFNLDILEEEENMIKLNKNLVYGRDIFMREGLLSQTKRYAKIILAAPELNEVDILNFPSKEEAEKKSAKLKKWPYKVITKARDTNGRYTKGYTLICCK